MLDLACGKGEMLCLFARDFGATGIGIDIHEPFVAAARKRATELGVEQAVTFIEGTREIRPSSVEASTSSVASEPRGLVVGSPARLR